jgi:predicted DNA repair protein MutK
MLWVGGSILVHGIAEFGFHGPEHLIDAMATSVAAASTSLAGVLHWLATSAAQAVLGILVGAVTIIAVQVVAPLIRGLRAKA